MKYAVLFAAESLHSPIYIKVGNKSEPKQLKRLAKKLPHTDDPEKIGWGVYEIKASNGKTYRCYLPVAFSKLKETLNDAG